MTLTEYKVDRQLELWAIDKYEQDIPLRLQSVQHYLDWYDAMCDSVEFSAKRFTLTWQDSTKQIPRLLEIARAAAGKNPGAHKNDPGSDELQ